MIYLQSQNFNFETRSFLSGNDPTFRWGKVQANGSGTFKNSDFEISSVGVSYSIRSIEPDF